jgi:hypothetical protein
MTSGFADLPQLALPTWLADVSVEVGPVPPVLDGATASGVLWQAAPGHFLLDVPESARYLVVNGRSLTVEPAAGADWTGIVRGARGTPMAALCYQRGWLVLHAAAAVRDDEAVLIAGDSATGKSTVVATLLARGWRLLSDDLTPVHLDATGSPVVRPTFGELMLWPDTVERLGNGSTAHREQWDRRLRLSVTDRFSPTPAPVGALWWLSVHGHDELDVAEIEGAKRVEALRTVAYNSQLAAALLEPTAFLRTAAAIADAVPVRRIRRPRGRWTPQEIADIVESGRGFLT